MTDPAAIAAKLTAGQESAIRSDFQAYCDPNTVRSLRRKGLAEGARLTDLGLAVRRILEGQGE